MIAIISYFLFIFVVLYMKFRPKILFKNEGLFIQYTIKGNLGDKETIIKQIM